MTDTSEYWNDVKRPRRRFVHHESIDCGHHHVIDTKGYHHVDCYACLEIINSQPEFKKQLQDYDAEILRRQEESSKAKSGFKTSSIIRFGKYKGTGKDIMWIFNHDRSYFNWLVTKIVTHPSLDKFIKDNNS